jgi:hypothetical protein
MSMKIRIPGLLIVICVALLAPSAFATCPTAPQGPYSSGGVSWMDYTPTDTSCITTVGGPATLGTMWCYNEAAWSIGTSSQATLKYSFEVDNFYAQEWDADLRIEFNDPNNSGTNYVELWAHVIHNGQHSWTMLFEHNGTEGDLSCARRGGHFVAHDNDTVEIVTYARKTNSNVTLEVSRPLIFSY